MSIRDISGIRWQDTAGRPPPPAFRAAFFLPLVVIVVASASPPARRRDRTLAQLCTRADRETGDRSRRRWQPPTDMWIGVREDYRFDGVAFEAPNLSQAHPFSGFTCPAAGAAERTSDRLRERREPVTPWWNINFGRPSSRRTKSSMVQDRRDLWAATRPVWFVFRTATGVLALWNCPCDTTTAVRRSPGTSGSAPCAVLFLPRGARRFKQRIQPGSSSPAESRDGLWVAEPGRSVRLPPGAGQSSKQPEIQVGPSGISSTMTEACGSLLLVTGCVASHRRTVCMAIRLASLARLRRASRSKTV